MSQLDACPKLYFGKHSLDALAGLPEGDVMVLCDPFMVESGIIAKVTSRLEAGGHPVYIFSGVTTDPSISTVTEAMHMMLRDKPDILIALGGGSAIDTTKAMMYFCLKYKEALMERRWVHRPYFVAVPTTAGSGSEVTSYTVVTDVENEVKIPISDRAMIPDVAILDPEFLKTLPKDLLAFPGMDVFTHSIEAYVSGAATAFTDLYALHAGRTVLRCLPRLYEGDLDDRACQDMMIAATMAGLAFHNSSLGLTHGIAHTLGAEFHLPHGKANAIVLPWVIAFNAGIGRYRALSRPELLIRYATFARELGLPAGGDEDAAAELIRTVQRLNKQFGIPESLAAAGVPLDALQANRAEMAEKILGDITTKSNPVAVDFTDVAELLTDIYAGGGPLG
ncbi:MAG: iron-containing alcohol dehydrogenase [Propionibacteriaceae bacterium]|jgi:acetaldehyde dehydrogenase/alcohol dehydrogenase|nr:iron-containing alcohol dehydrogenase [Propionibacteriaceae bacterium]